MQKVVGINLNGNAYQLEEPGYEALRSYLQRADSRLQANPDRAEIMADLEQAIAEKCGRYLGASKNVVTEAEIGTIIAEMGPVESPEAIAASGAAGAGAGVGIGASAGGSADAAVGASGGTGAGAGAAGTEGGTHAGARAGAGTQAGAGMGAGTGAGSGAKAGAAHADAARDTRRRLYQIREGAMISGVCNGLAAFLDIDVTVVRLLFVIITFATFGAWILAYLAMAFFIPYADTPEDRAAAFGLRLKAEELLGANLHRASARARREWRRTFRREQRAWQRNWHERWNRNWGRQWHEHMAQQTQAASGTGAPPPMMGVGHAVLGISLPLVAIVNAAVFVAWILVVISAVLTGTIFGWPLPAQLPLWGSLLILFAIYIALTAPLRAARHAHMAWGPYYSPWAAIAGVFWLGFSVLFLWLAYQHIPEVHALLDELPSLWQNRQTSFVEVARELLL
jgi:phage shock protein PspC (stress-responsive transcriptional regulator)